MCFLCCYYFELSFSPKDINPDMYALIGLSITYMFLMSVDILAKILEALFKTLYVFNQKTQNKDQGLIEFVRSHSLS